MGLGIEEKRGKKTKRIDDETRMEEIPVSWKRTLNSSPATTPDKRVMLGIRLQTDGRVNCKKIEMEHDMLPTLHTLTRRAYVGAMRSDVSPRQS